MRRTLYVTGTSCLLLLGSVGCVGSIGAPNGNGNATGTATGTPTGTPQGSAGTTGTAGTTGAAGTGSAGTTGIAGVGAAGTTGIAGTGVVTTGSGGTGSGGTFGACTSGVAVTSQVARLTNEQYDNTIYDLLGLNSLTASGGVAPSQVLATDQAGSLTDVGWSAYKTVGDKIAAQVMADANLKKNFMACTPTGDGKTCLHDTIVKFGRKAFRRPLSTDEVAAFDALVAKGKDITATGSTDEIASTLLYAFLVSPSFLMRGEVNQASGGATGLYALSSHEVASRLSYLLWGSTPDDTLNTAADANQLTTAAQILTQAQRMIMSPKARGKVSAFHRTYTLMGTNTRWDNSNHDTTLFPAFSKAIVPALQAETEKFFDEVVFTKNGTFQTLMTSNVAYVTASIAPLYGLGASGFGTDFKETQLDATQRPGFLTRLGFLNAYSAYNRSSPILRGAFITKQIIGTPIMAPPPGAEATALPAASTDLNTNRKQVDAQTAGPACVSCHHDFINPPGFIMEAYNSVGAWQTTEATSKAPIDLVVDMTIDGAKVHLTSPAEMMAAIAASPMTQHRYAEKWVNYAYEREGDPLDTCTINDLATKINAGGYTVRTLVTDLTQTQQFRTRTVGVTQ